MLQFVLKERISIKSDKVFILDIHRSELNGNQWLPKVYMQFVVPVMGRKHAECQSFFLCGHVINAIA